MRLPRFSIQAPFARGGGVAKPQQQSVFRGEGVSIPELKADTVEISAKDKIEEPQKEGLSTGAKWTLGVGGTLTALVTAGLLVARHDHKKLLKLCKDKIKLSELPEHLEYKATTREEAMKFAKETLGIKEVDESFTDLALHDTLKAIVDVSNANKGKVYITPKLKFVKMQDKVLATANHSIQTDAYGTLSINKKYYDNDFLTKKLKEFLGTSEKSANNAGEKVANKTKKEVTLGIAWSDRYRNLADRFIESPEKLTLAEKRELYLTQQETIRNYKRLNNPKVFLNHFKKYLENAGIKYDYDSILKLSKKEQLEKIAKLRAEFQEKTNTVLGLETTLNNPHQTIYHEMGHLQDYTQNLEDLILKDSAWSRFKRIFTSRKEDLKIKNKEELEAVGSRWSKISDFAKDGKTGRELLEGNKERFKQALPDLYEHVTNKEIQMTAGEVSEYAKEGVGEFVAEVYAKMINGDKLSDDVLALYKKYNGPLPASYLK